MGSTASSTALLQYEIDVPLLKLARTHGSEDASLAYRACAQALDSWRRCAPKSATVATRAPAPGM